MPPKKKDKKKKEEVEEPIPEPQEAFSDDSIAEREFDLLTDINDDFFSSANKVIQNLVETERPYEAMKLKRYIDIMYNLHRKYAEEVKENSELKPKVIAAETKLRLALDLTINSKEAMDELKQALGEAWQESDASLLREQEIQSKMQELILKCESFESKESETTDDAQEFGNLARYKNIILRERDRLNGEVIDLEKRLQMQRFYSESLEYLNKNNEDAMNKMTTRVKVLDSEKATLDIKIRTLMSNLEDSKETNTKTQHKLETTNRELQETQSKLQQKLSDIDRQKLIIEKLRSDNVVNNRTILKYEDEITDLRKELKHTDEALRTLTLEDKVKANTISQLQKKYKKATQDHSTLSSKMYKLNRTNHALNQDIMRLKNEINALEKDLYFAAYKYDDLRRLKDNIQHERDNLRSDVVKLNNVIADLRHTMMIHNNTIDSLHLDINKLNVKLDEAKINISKAEKERDEMAQEVESLHERIEYYQEEVQIKTDQVADLSEKLQQKQAVLINIKKQLETAHSDKMMLRRSLETCTQERDNFRVLQTKTSHQIAQLTTEIAVNQNKINSLNLHIERLNNEKKELQSELRNTHIVLKNVRGDLKDSKAKNESLLKTIADDELKFMKISQELFETRKEKNLIGLQMVRRNDEIVLLKEKNSIMQTALDQGQTQYNQRVEDVRLLKIEVKNLRTERDCLSRAIKSTADMRVEIIRLQRALNQERVKVRSLTEDAKTPTGVHRWRILKGEDPSKFKLLEKVQALQKRNLKSEIEKTNLQQKLDEVQKVADSLRKVIENLPTTDVKQKLVATQRLNFRQMKELKALKAELSIDHIELKARECIIEKYKSELNLLKFGKGPTTETHPDNHVDSKNVTIDDQYSKCVYETTDNSQNSLFSTKESKSEKLVDDDFLETTEGVEAKEM